MTCLVSAKSTGVAFEQKVVSTASPIKKWLHNHPTYMKAAIVGLAALGIYACLEGLAQNSFYQVAAGLMLVGLSYAAFKVAPIFIPPTHNPKAKAFKEGEYEGVTLKYQGNIPILTIPKSVTPYKAGFARGYLMAKQIKDLIEKNRFAFFTLRGLPAKVPNLVAKVKETIKEYLDEMQGLADGYNKLRESWYLKGEEITLEDVIYFHLLPEVGNLDFQATDDWAKRHPDNVMGCSVVIDSDEDKSPKAMRTVDWIPMDVYGTYSFIEFRETESGVRYVNHSFPLFVGGLTAMNEFGLTACINVARGLTDYPEHMPAVFYVRNLIENCKSVLGDEKTAAEYWKKEIPLGAFNLSLLDRKNAVSVHFYQGLNNSTYERFWERRPKEPLVTLNFRYGERGETNPTPTNSVQRKAEIEKYYEQERGYNHRAEHRLKTLLKGAEVNNIRTTSSVYLNPETCEFKISFDNGYSGDLPLNNVYLESWLLHK